MNSIEYIIVSLLCWPIIVNDGAARNPRILLKVYRARIFVLYIAPIRNDKAFLFLKDSNASLYKSSFALNSISQEDIPVVLIFNITLLYVSAPVKNSSLLFSAFKQIFLFIALYCISRAFNAASMLFVLSIIS